MSQCLLCGRRLNSPLSLKFLLSFKRYRAPIICHHCRAQFTRISGENRCRDCSLPGTFEHRLCPDCVRWRRLTGHRFQNYGLYRYNAKMSEFMHRYKFQGDYRLRQIFRDDMKRTVKRFNRPVVPIPIHQNTYDQRGFNQVKGLLDDVKMVNVLTTNRKRKTVPQSRKTRDDRLKLPQPFQLRDGSKDLIKNRKVLLVDDVYTTGTTIRHAARLLKQAGAKLVTGLTLSR